MLLTYKVQFITYNCKSHRWYDWNMHDMNDCNWLIVHNCATNTSNMHPDDAAWGVRIRNATGSSNSKRLDIGIVDFETMKANWTEDDVLNPHNYTTKPYIDAINQAIYNYESGESK